ncbi:hypothetical protein MMC12_008272 [Toensbergia leucococca]|nr:hypothetical protein [Toensbergia leucococca]
MGQGTSKPPPSSTQHVFARWSNLPIPNGPSHSQLMTSSETPVRFSQDLVDALQASPETDSTRAKDLELHIQSRVASELSRLEAEQSQALAELEDRISNSPDTTTESNNTAAQPSLPDQSASRGGVDHAAKAKGDKMRGLSREIVQKEIDSLRKKLEVRRLKEDVVGDKEVEKAKGEVVACLRINDRRPLDCWREVEAFKREVGRLERGFLGRVGD